MAGASRPAPRNLTPWLLAAIAANFAATMAATSTPLFGEAGLYLAVAFYAVPAAVGLHRVRMLGRWRAVTFGGLVFVAHAAAISVTIRLLLGPGEALRTDSPALAGAIGGAIGALVPLVGLGLMKRGWDERTTLLVTGFSVVLAALGAGFLAAMGAGWGTRIEWLYVAWQALFSLAILLIARVGAG